MKWLSVLLFMLTTQAMAQQQQVTFEKSGSISFFPYYLVHSFRFTDEDGALAKFEGEGYGGRIIFKPFPEWLPGLSLTTDFSNGTSENSADKNEELEYSSVSYGLSQYMNRFLFLSGKYGRNKLKFTNGGSETKMSPDFLSIVIGLDILQVGDTFAFTAEAQYNKGFSEKTKNINAAYNSGFDGVEYHVGIRWSPSVSFTAPAR